MQIKVKQNQYITCELVVPAMSFADKILKNIIPTNGITLDLWTENKKSTILEFFQKVFILEKKVEKLNMKKKFLEI